MLYVGASETCTVFVTDGDGRERQRVWEFTMSKGERRPKWDPGDIVGETFLEGRRRLFCPKRHFGPNCRLGPSPVPRTRLCTGLPPAPAYRHAIPSIG